MTTPVDEYRRVQTMYLTKGYADTLTDAEEDEAVHALDHLWWKLTLAERQLVHAEGERLQATLGQSSRELQRQVVDERGDSEG